MSRIGKYPVNFDDKVPAVVKQFMSNNQLKSAGIVVYILTNDTYKLVLNFRERPNGAGRAEDVETSCLWWGENERHRRQVES